MVLTKGARSRPQGCRASRPSPASPSRTVCPSGRRQGRLSRGAEVPGVLGSSGRWRLGGLNRAQGFGGPDASLPSRSPLEPAPTLLAKRVSVRGPHRGCSRPAPAQHPVLWRFPRRFWEARPPALPRGVSSVSSDPVLRWRGVGRARVSAALSSLPSGPEPGEGSRGEVRTQAATVSNGGRRRSDAFGHFGHL